MGNLFRGVTNIIKKIISAVRGAVKFFATLIGHITLYVIAAILLAILIYIIAQVIASAIAGLLNIDAPGDDEQAKDLAFLTSLEDSGYSDMLSAEDLMKYYSYEYCVLMDAARYLEETGTTEMKVQDEAVLDLHKINRLQWAYLAAIKFQIGGEVSNSTLGKDYMPETVSEVSGDPTTEYTMGKDGDSGDLFYEKKYNEYTKNISLQPFFKIDKDNETLRYFFEIRDGAAGDDPNSAYYTNADDQYNGAGQEVSNSNSQTVSPGDVSMTDASAATLTESSQLAHGSHSNLDNLTFVGPDGKTYTGRQFLGQLFRFEGGVSWDGVSDVATAAAFIYRYVWALKFNADLNQANIAAFTNKDVRYNSAGGMHVPLDQDNFAEDLYYQDTNVQQHYHIPLRVLLDRFLPNASLLSSWRLLSEDENKKTDAPTIVDEIFKIYDEACLKDESGDDDKILVKDVAKVTSTISADNKATDLFKTSFLTDKEIKLDKYYNNEDTSTVYGSYLALFDTRSGDDKKVIEQGDEEENPNAFKQSFPAETIIGDVLDDLKLVITHYADDRKISYEDKEAFINNTLKDASGELTEKIGDDTSGTKEVILYRRNSNGTSFLVDCVGVTSAVNGDYATLRQHYNIANTVSNGSIECSQTGEKNSTEVRVSGSLRNHQDYTNPYDSSYKDCFIPFIKIAFKVDKGLKKTAVIIYDDYKYFGYMVTSKEIINYANISNAKTFIEMEHRILKSTTFKHWELAQGEEISDEAWLVTNAFEGLGVDISVNEGGFKFSWKRDWSWDLDQYTTTRTISGEEITTTHTRHSAGSETDYVDEDFAGLSNPELLEDLGISGDAIMKMIIAGKDWETLDLDAMKKEHPHLIYDANRTAIVREAKEFGGTTESTLEAIKKIREWEKATVAELFNLLGVEHPDSYSPNASPSVGMAQKTDSAGNLIYGGECTTTSEPGETVFTDYNYLNLYALGFTPNDPIPEDKLHLDADEIAGYIKDYLNKYFDFAPGNEKFCTIFRYYLWENYQSVVTGINSAITGPRDKANFTSSVIMRALEIVAEEYKKKEFESSKPTMTDSSGRTVCESCLKLDRVEAVKYIGGDPFYINSLNEDLRLHVVMPTRIAICPITQRIIDRTMDGYFVKNSEYWAAVKDFDNTELIKGEFLKEDRDNYHFLITNNDWAGGLHDIKSEYKKLNWRTKLFAPIFGGLNSTEQQREDDVKLIFSEWENVGNSGVNAADHAIRDLNYLVKYSKGIKADENDNTPWKAGSDSKVDPSFARQPELADNGAGKYYPYVNYTSFTYIYVPEEILQFNELTSEKIFWIDRLVSVPQDPIDDKYENKMRSRLNTFTWQVVDYNLYPETTGEDGKHKAYALWLFGDQASRDLYSIDSNANLQENGRIKDWGGFTIAHPAADLYGRSQAQRIFNTAYGHPESTSEKTVFNEIYGYAYRTYYPATPSIRAKVSGKNVVLYTGDEPETTDFTDVSDLSGEYFYYGDNGNLESTSLGATDAGSDYLYSHGASVTITLGGKDYIFPGPASAAYGYNLYILASQIGDGEKAEQELKKQLEKEMQWQEVRALAPGIVSNVYSNGGGGFGVTITHADTDETITTSYSHMKRYPLVQVGQYVGAGTVLGYEGTTGKSGGYHCHLALRKGNSSGSSATAQNPGRYMYPFFSPFWYQEKADEALEDSAVRANPLSNSYFSMSRTSFPYGQKITAETAGNPDGDATAEQISEGINATNDDNVPVKTVEYTNKLNTWSGGYINIKNYTPQYPLTTDADNLKSKSDGENFEKLYTDGTVHSIGGSNWKGDELHTNPDYIDEDFIADVYANGQKISGVPSRAIQNIQ